MIEANATSNICISTSAKNTPSNSIDINIISGGSTTEVYFKSEQKLSLSSQVESAVLLLPAMQSGVTKIDLQQPLDHSFKDNQQVLQDIYTSWYPEFTRVDFQSTNTSEDSDVSSSNNEPQKRIGMFFSGGMDSFYSFLKHKEKVTDLIFVHGYDIALSDTELRQKTSNQLRKVAKENNVNLIEIETNLRNFLDKYVDWGKLGHGAALVAIGHLLSNDLDSIYIPSSYNYANLFPWGTHPLLDPHWSSSQLRFIHDGCEAKRVDKAKLVSTSMSALQSLRVCWKNPNSAYNCCKCEKCIRTMINLEIHDALKHSNVFPEELTMEKVRNMPINSHSAKEFVIENIKALKGMETKSELLNALIYALNKKPQSPPIHHLIRRRLRTLLCRD